MMLILWVREKVGNSRHSLELLALGNEKLFYGKKVENDLMHIFPMKIFFFFKCATIRSAIRTSKMIQIAALLPQTVVNCSHWICRKITVCKLVSQHLLLEVYSRIFT